jgi:hypothetical protein
MGRATDLFQKIIKIKIKIKIKTCPYTSLIKHEKARIVGVLVFPTFSTKTWNDWASWKQKGVVAVATL